MKRLSFAVSSVVVLAIGCSRPPEPPGGRLPTGQSARQPMAIATSGGVLAATDSGAHVFAPRPHPAHSPAPVSAVDLGRLPRMKRTECFAEVVADSLSLPRGSQGGGLSAIGTTGAGSGYSGGVTSAPRKPSSQPNPFTPPPSPPAPQAGAAGPSGPPATAAAAPAAAPPPAPAQRAQNEAARPSTPATAARSDASKKKEASAELEKRPLQMAAPEPEPEGPREYHDYGASIYLSNDDTMSLSSAQRVLFAIDRFLPVPEDHIRPHELLNYFSFQTAPIAPTDDFSVYAEIGPKPGKPGEFTLGLSVSGRSFSKDERRNAALTFVIDRSGSMRDEGRMDYLKRGLARMTSELKRGDMVSLVAFDDRVCSPLENFVVGRDPMQILTSTIQRLSPRGSTDVDLGLRTGYAIADRSYQSTHSNRVVLITDALANTGETDPNMMAMISAHYDKRRIRLSGVGVGTEFNDALLDRLTERGKGAYVFLGSPAEVDAVFGERFVSLIETTANDVHFKLQLPPSLRMNVFYGEESSTVEEDVQAIHYFAGTSQLFLSDLMARTSQLPTQDSVMLSIEYEHPETSAKQFEEFAFNLGDIARHDEMLQKGRLIISFVDGLADTVRSTPSRSDRRAGGWLDATASEQCARGRDSLAEQSRSLAGDREVQRVVELWDQYCSRYEPARAPVRRTPPQGRDVWPSAQR